MLGYLISFRQVGVEIILPGKIPLPADPGITGNAQSQGVFNCLMVEKWQGPGMTQRDRADMGIWIRPEKGFISAEKLALCLQLRMHFQSDHHFINGMHVRHAADLYK
jgi:hypothetical protein